MANSKSALKRARTNEIKRVHRATQKSALRTDLKKFLTAVEQKNTESAKELLNHANKSLDKAVTKGLIKKNTAARKKSRLTKKYNTLSV